MKHQPKPHDDWREYTKRAQALTALGYADYAEYLASPVWAAIRKARLAMQARCMCCPAPADIVHHNAYDIDVLRGDPTAIKRDLFPLCTICHCKVEFDGKRKRSSGEASEVLLQLVQGKLRKGTHLPPIEQIEPTRKKPKIKHTNPSKEARKAHLAHALHRTKTRAALQRTSAEIIHDLLAKRKAAREAQ